MGRDLTPDPPHLTTAPTRHARVESQNQGLARLVRLRFGFAFCFRVRCSRSVSDRFAFGFEPIRRQLSSLRTERHTDERRLKSDDRADKPTYRHASSEDRRKQ